MTESQLKSNIIKMLRLEYPQAWVYKTCDRFQSGIPDLIICYWGRFFAIEIKTPQNSKRNKLQEFTLFDIKSRGRGIAEICRSVDEVRVIMNSWSKT